MATRIPGGSHGAGSGRFLQRLLPVVVGVQPQPQHPEHEDAPLRQAGAARLRAGLAFRADPPGEHFPQDGKHALAQFGFCVEVLQPPQQLRDVVAGLGIQFDVGDGRFGRVPFGGRTQCA